MEKIKDFVKYVLGDKRDKHGDLVFDKVQVIAAKEEGFHVDFVRRPEGGMGYNMHIPSKFKSLGFFTRLTLRHEVAHIIFEEMYRLDLDGINQWMMMIEDHRLFMFVQNFWYWNRLLRWVKRKLGFSYNIQYDPDDYYDDNGAFTRRDNELFCDWFAIKEKVWK